LFWSDPQCGHNQAIPQSRDKDPLVSVLTSNQDFRSLPDFPFSSWLSRSYNSFSYGGDEHDFWLRNLTHPCGRLCTCSCMWLMLAGWSCDSGLLQSETSALLAVAPRRPIDCHHASRGCCSREAKVDARARSGCGWICIRLRVNGIPEKCATVVSVNGERVAIFQARRKSVSDFECLPHQNAHW